MAHILNKLKIGTLWGVISQGGLGILAILISAVLARTLETQDLALFFLVLPLIKFLSLLQSFGMPSGVQKSIGIAAHDGDAAGVGRIIRTAGVLFLWILPLLAFGYALLWPSLDDALFSDRFPLAMGAVIFAVMVLRAAEQIGAAILRGAQHMRLGLLFTGAPREFLFLLILLLGWGAVGGWKIESVLYSYLAVSIATILILFFLIARNVHTPPTAGETLDVRGFAQLCWPMMLHSGAAILFISVDVWVLGLFRSEAEVALYGAVSRLIIIIPFAAYILNMVLPSLVAALYDKGHLRKLTVLVRTAATGSLVIGGTVAAIFVVFGDHILSAVFGPGFKDGWEILIILAMGQSANIAFGSPGVVLQMTGRHTTLMVATLITSLANLTGNLLVVSKYGVVGVAMVTSFSLVIQNVGMTVLAYRQAGVLTLPHPAMLRPRFLRHVLRR